MAMAVAISPGSLILLILLQNTFAQQCVNNGVYKSTPAGLQQIYQQTNCASNQNAQSGLNLNPQQPSAQQVYQQSNIQQAPYQSSSLQPQINFQHSCSQQPANSITNSPPSKQQNQDLASIFSALYNIRQPTQNQRTNNVNGNPSQLNNEQQFLSQNQQNPTFVVTAPISKTHNSQPNQNSYSESLSYQPVLSYQSVSTSNVPTQQSQQVYTIPVHKISEEPSQRYSIPDPPVSNTGTNQQAMQNSAMMIPNSQVSSVQSQPIVFAVQPTQVTSVPNQQPPSQSQPQTIYTVQTQPSAEISQNQQILETPRQQAMNNFPQAMNNIPMDKQSLMSLVMSQMQGQQGRSSPLTSMLPGIPQGGGNPIASILPAMLSSKSEKSSSMKAILPLLFALLNDRKGGYGCPNCGYNHNQNNEISMPEPIINTGYSNQINYSQQNPVEVFAKMTDQPNKSEKYTKKETEENKIKEIINNSPENYEEDEEIESEEYEEE